MIPFICAAIILFIGMPLAFLWNDLKFFRVWCLTIALLAGAGFITSILLREEPIKTEYEFPCEGDTLRFYYEEGNKWIDPPNPRPKVTINGVEF